MSAERIFVRVPAFLAEHIPDFVRETRAQLAEARRAAARGDFGASRTVGHNLKGSAGAFGCHELGTLGGQLEDAAAAHDPGRVERMTTTIEEYLDRMQIVPEPENPT